MRYVIWHTPRTGSNVLCDCLVQTGLAGMRSLNDAGLFIGFGEGTAQAYAEGGVDAYFTRNRTPNGVEGCKLGWDYVEHLNHNLAHGDVDTILGGFDRHILITRRNRVAQAVSRLVAKQTGQWTSLDNRLDVVPVYSRSRIEYLMAQSAGNEAAIMTWLSLNGIQPLLLEYETNQKDWQYTIHRVLQFIDVKDFPVSVITPTLQRQSEPIKGEWIERYMKGE